MVKPMAVFLSNFIAINKGGQKSAWKEFSENNFIKTYRPENPHQKGRIRCIFARDESSEEHPVMGTLDSTYCARTGSGQCVHSL